MGNVFPRLISSAIVLASAVFAQTAKFCPQAESGDLCYQVGVPDATASSGSGDIYFQIQGPASKQWIGLGQGSRMAGANIFMVYADSSGTNVTLSPRPGEGHQQPKFDQGIQAFLLEGSGIANGVMTANVRCASCITWQSSTLDLTSTDSNWIWAARDGSAVKSDDLRANLDIHDSNGQFTFDLTQARSGNSLNPFVDTAVSGTTSAASPSASAASQSSSTSSSSAGDGDNDSDNGSSNSDSGSSSNGGNAYGSTSSDSGSQERRPSSKIHNILIAHGVLMCLAWVIFFPLGAIVIRAISARNVIHIHSITQSFAYILAITGMALGIYIAVKPEYVIDMYHPVIGLVVMGLATVQPILGTIHHKTYRAKGERTWWGVAHTMLGRVVITLAIINGGLGLRMAENTRGGEIAYGVIAGIIWLTWMGVAVWSEAKRARLPAGQEKGVEKVSS